MANEHREKPQWMAAATVKVEAEGKEQPNSKQDLMPGNTHRLQSLHNNYKPNKIKETVTLKKQEQKYTTKKHHNTAAKAEEAEERSRYAPLSGDHAPARG
ncbi:hypothetical protein SLA2020_367620 [Shorea laevis]